MKNKNNSVETTIKQGKDFVESMVSIADYLNENNKDHLVKGKYFKRAKQVLLHYRQMKHYSITFATNISADQCRREIEERNEDIFNYYLKYDNLPDERSRELATVASVYDVFEFCGDNFHVKELEKYINSRKATYETILTSFCEQVLLRIKEQDKDAFDALYTEFFNLATEDMKAPEKWELLNVGHDSYYRYLNKGITLFSHYLFSPSGEIYLEKNDNKKHKEIIEHLKKATMLATEILKKENEPSEI